MRPKVSIIVPNYNHCKFLEQRLRSIFSQTFQDFEVILLDDFSSDNSIEIIKHYKNHKKVTHTILNNQNSGSPFKQWGRGIAVARGQWIWIAESDDFCSPKFLSEILKEIRKNKEIGLAYCASAVVNENGMVINKKIIPKMVPTVWDNNFKTSGASFIKDLLVIQNVIPNASGVVFSRSLVSNIDWKSIESMSFCGDWMFYMQLLENTEIVYLNETLNFFRSHSKVTRVHDTMGKKRKRIVEEVAIKNLAQRKYKIHNNLSNNQLINNWNKLFSFKDVFLSNQYSKGILDNFSRLEYIISYLKSKI